MIIKYISVWHDEIDIYFSYIKSLKIFVIYIYDIFILKIMKDIEAIFFKYEDWYVLLIFIWSDYLECVLWNWKLFKKIERKIIYVNYILSLLYLKL